MAARTTASITRRRISDLPMSQSSKLITPTPRLRWGILPVVAGARAPVRNSSRKATSPVKPTGPARSGIVRSESPRKSGIGKGDRIGDVVPLSVVRPSRHWIDVTDGTLDRCAPAPTPGKAIRSLGSQDKVSKGDRRTKGGAMSAQGGTLRAPIHVPIRRMAAMLLAAVVALGMGSASASSWRSRLASVDRSWSSTGDRSSVTRRAGLGSQASRRRSVSRATSRSDVDGREGAGPTRDRPSSVGLTPGPSWLLRCRPSRLAWRGPRPPVAPRVGSNASR